MSEENLNGISRRPPPIWRWQIVPVAGLLLAAAAAVALGLHHYLTFDELARHRAALMQWQERHEGLSIALFISVYAMTVALSLPGAVLLTVAGGFLFGVIGGALYSVIGATLGSCAVFLVARHLADRLLRARAGPWIRAMQVGFQRDAFSYLLVLRLLPIFPFWLVNLVPAFLDVRLRIFIVGTLFGIIPGSLLYALAGSGLDAVFAAGKQPDLDILFRPDILAALIGLALLSLAPVFYRWVRHDPDPRGNGGDPDA